MEESLKIMFQCNRGWQPRIGPCNRTGFARSTFSLFQTTVRIQQGRAYLHDLMLSSTQLLRVWDPHPNTPPPPAPLGGMRDPWPDHCAEPAELQEKALAFARPRRRLFFLVLCYVYHLLFLFVVYCFCICLLFVSVQTTP